MRPFIAGVKLEAWIVRSTPDTLIPFFTAPLFTIIFLMIVRHGGRHDLQPDALMAPVLMTLWWFALFHGGNLITGDRWQGMLEWILAAPATLAAVLLGRIALIMSFGSLGFFEVWGVGRVIFGVTLPFEHPLALALTLFATLFAMAATSVLIAGLFVMTRNSYTFANSASFPFYVLGGVFVPVAILPGWIRPVTSGVFLSWSSDLLRASLKPPAIHDLWGRLGMLVLIGAVTFVLGRLLLVYVLRRMRRTGELATV
jgi:ABC-2 type transport system permease protein